MTAFSDMVWWCDHLFQIWCDDVTKDEIGRMCVLCMFFMTSFSDMEWWCDQGLWHLFQIWCDDVTKDEIGRMCALCVFFIGSLIHVFQIPRDDVTVHGCGGWLSHIYRATHLTTLIHWCILVHLFHIRGDDVTEDERGGRLAFATQCPQPPCPYYLAL